MKIDLLYIEANPSAQARFKKLLDALNFIDYRLSFIENVAAGFEDYQHFTSDIVFIGLNNDSDATNVLQWLATRPRSPKCVLLASLKEIDISNLPSEALELPLFSQETFDSQKLQKLLAPIIKVKELQASEALQNVRTQSIENSNNLYLFRTDRKGNYTYVNAPFQKAYLGSEQQFIGKSSSLNIIKADQHLAEEISEKALNQPGKVFSTYLRRPTYPSGNITRSKWEFTALLDSLGNFKEIQCLGFKSSESNITELEISQDEQYFEATHSKSLSLILDASLTIKLAKGAPEILGNPQKEPIVGHSFLSYIVDADLMIWEYYFQAHKSQQDAKESTKIRLKDDSNRVFWVEIKLAMLSAQEKSEQKRYQLNLQEVKPLGQLEKEKQALLVQSLETLEELKSLQKALDGHALVAFTDADGNYLYVNNFYAQTSGYSVSELIGQSIRLVQSDLHPEEYQQEISRTLKSGKVWHGEQKNRRKDGSFFWTKSTISPRLNEENGEIINYINILTDISSQKFVEKELVHSQNTLYNTLNSINQELWSVNRKYELTIFNKVFQQNFEYFFKFDIRYRQNMLGIDALPLEIREEFKKRYDLAFKGETAQYFDEYYDPNEDRTKYLDVRLGPTINEKNEISGATVYSQDITERIEKEKELKELLIRFELATKSNNIGIWDFDLKADKLIWDEKMFALYNMEGKTDIAWDEWAKVIEPESLAKTEAEFTKAIEQGSNYEATFKVITQNGYKWIASMAKIIRNTNGEAIRAIGLNWDITKTVDYEENLEQSLKEKEDILNSIHDGFLVLNQGMEILSINKSACKVLDIKEEEMIGKSLWPSDEDKKASEFYPLFKQALNTQTSVSVEGIDRVSKNWIDATAYPKENGLVIFFKDVTIEKTRSIELEKIRNNQLALINTTDDLIWSLNTKLELVAFNEQFSQHQLKMGALMPTEGRYIFNKHQASYRDLWKIRYEKALAGQIIKETIIEEEISFSLAIYPIINAQNETEGIACYARDITDMEAYLHAIEKQNNELKDIAWMQSHIVRAPVARILGLVELIHAEKLDHNRNLATYLQSINASAQELDGIIEKISEKTHSAKIKGI